EQFAQRGIGRTLTLVRAAARQGPACAILRHQEYLVFPRTDECRSFLGLVCCRRHGHVVDCHLFFTLYRPAYADADIIVAKFMSVVSAFRTRPNSTVPVPASTAPVRTGARATPRYEPVRDRP